MAARSPRSRRSARYTQAQLEAKTVTEIKSILTNEGLATTGRKYELIDRYLASKPAPRDRPVSKSHKSLSPKPAHPVSEWDFVPSIIGIVASDGTFRISPPPENSRFPRSRGKLAVTVPRSQLIDFMRDIGTDEISEWILEDHEAAILKLKQLGINHTPTEMRSWNSPKLNYYLWWYTHPTYTRPIIAGMIKDRLQELGHLMHLE